MRNGTGEGDCLHWPAEMLVTTLDVLGRDIAHDPDPSLFEAMLVPLTRRPYGNFGRVDLDRGVDQRWVSIPLWIKPSVVATLTIAW